MTLFKLKLTRKGLGEITTSLISEVPYLMGWPDPEPSTALVYHSAVLTRHCQNCCYILMSEVEVCPL